MMPHSSSVIVFTALVLLQLALVASAHGFDHEHDEDDSMDPEEAMLRRQQALDEPREKVTIGVLSRPSQCAKKVQEGSKVAVELTLQKITPSETKAGELERVDVLSKKQKLIIVGSGRFLEGVESGLLGACVNEKRSLRIPASLGFAEEGSKKLNVPPETELRAVVTVMDVEDPDPYGEDMDDMTPDEDMDDAPPGSRDEDDDEDAAAGPPIPEEDFHLHVPKVTGEELVDLMAKKSVFVMFYAPWCGHCTAIKPKYAQVARAFRGDASRVAIVAVDATEEEEAAQTFEVSGFPTLLLIKQGSSRPVKYAQARTVSGMVAAINDAFKTERLINGRLSEFAGTVEDLNAHVVRWQNGEISLTELAAALPAGSYYKRVVESIQANGKAYVSREKNRLSKMFAEASASVKAEQLDSMQRRINILDVFHDERDDAAAAAPSA